MTTNGKRLGQVGLLLGVLLLLARFYTPLNRFNPFLSYRVERPYYTTFIDAAGNRLWATAHPVFRGDELWAGPDTRFVVRRVRRRIAYLEAVPAAPLDPQWRPARVDTVAAAAPRPALPLAARARNVALFHTRVSESDIPTQGQAVVKGKGGILQVGAVFAGALQGMVLPSPTIAPPAIPMMPGRTAVHGRPPSTCSGTPGPLPYSTCTAMRRPSSFARPPSTAKGPPV